ncbi:hypothetical protein KFE25_005081 [Diacronema lutheri]|uniref:Tetratricopeptide repeat protein 21B n=3 Tax=Diacronema lutheri TaxID=2081491 RepID=A0A8J5X7N4_DIALT|nr:hypothetical protein KFE25_005081 [Diacronema lutheri]
MSAQPGATAEVQGLCNYYARAGYYRHIQTVCNEFLRKKSNSDPALVFWRAYGAMREGSINEAIRDLDSIRREGELLFAVLVALLHAHNLSKIVDTDEVARIGAALDRERARVGERGLLMAAQFAWHAERLEDAREYVERLLALKPGSTQGNILRCWIELSAGALPAHELWDAHGGKKELEALMGKARHAETLGQHAKALDNLNQVIVHYAWFLPALAEKAKLLMAMANWPQAAETAQRVLSLDAHNIDGLRVSALFLLSQEAQYDTAQQRIADLTDALDRNEPKNAALFDALARPLARLAGRQPAILRLTHALIDRACRLAPFNAAYVIEKAYQFTLMNNFAAAAATYREAHTLDESDTAALLGQIRCQVEAGELRSAAAQLEFIAAMQETVGSTVDLEFVSALVAARHARDTAGAVAHLDACYELHMAALNAEPFGLGYFAQLNPHFLLELADEYMAHAGAGPAVREHGSSEARALSQALRVLALLRKHTPGLLDGQMLLARARYLNADPDGALQLLAHCANVAPTYAPASLLHAQILLEQQQPRAAHAVLDGALAHNFEIRDALLYHIVRASSLAADGALADALGVLHGAMKLPGVREGGQPAPARMPPPSAHERCSVYLQTVDVLVRLERADEAGTLMRDAISAFAGTDQEGRITLANCELLVAKGDVEGALGMLRAVQSSNPTYHRAKVLLAEIYLKHRNDRRLYCACHEELARASPSVATYVALGEAYLNVQEPKKAIAAFEQALQRSPGDANLASRIGKALVSTHDYVRAIGYYDGAIKADPTKSALKHELAALYLRLKKYDLAQETLEELLEGAAAFTGATAARPPPARTGEVHVQELMREVGGWRLLAQALRARSKLAPAAEALQRARAAQQRVVATVVSDAPDALPAQRALLSDISIDIAHLHAEHNSSDEALASFLEALKYSPSSAKATLSLAKLYLQRGEVEQCQHQCVALIKLDPENIDGSLMLADLMLRKADYDPAIFHFAQLLEKEPTHFLALRKLIVLCRHAGRLAEARPFVERAKSAHAKASTKVGLEFCAGLLARHESNPSEALARFNAARRDSEWGQLAVEQMIEVYIGAEGLIDWADESGEGAAAQGEPRPENLAAAEHLLRELRPSKKRQVLDALLAIARRGRSNAESAINRLLEVLQADQDYAPALVAAALGYLTLRQAPKARNHLKRIAKLSYQPEYADDFELGWLLLAHVYIQSGKFDIAEELCKRALAANRSCALAYELLGTIKEKELSYTDAAHAYERAWQLEHEAGATVGFKLAFNLLKAKEYVGAIDVCHKVLRAYPDYPRIQKDILEKARMALRA